MVPEDSTGRNAGWILMHNVAAKRQTADGEAGRDQHLRLPFPNRAAGLAGAASAASALDRGGVQRALREVAAGCGLKKRSHRTVFATATPPI